MTAPETLFEEAVARHRSGDIVGAEALYREVLGAEPLHPGALANLGHIRRKRGENDEAIGYYRQAVASGTAPAQVHFNLAAALADRGAGPGDLEEARDNFDVAIARQPDLRAAHLGRLRLAARMLRPREAARLAEAAAAACPGDGTVALEAARALLAAEETGRAIRHLLGALADSSLPPVPLTELASLLMSAGEGEASIRALRRVVELSPRSATAHFNLAVGLRKTHHFTKAIAAFDEAAALGFDAESIGFERAACLVRLRRGEEARGIFDEIVEAGGDREGTCTALMAGLYDADRTGADICERHRRGTRHWPVALRRPAPARRPAGAPLAVAFLSGDYQGAHPVAQFTLPLLERLPALGVAPTVYLTAKGTDPTAAWLERTVPTRSLIGLDDEAAADLIAADGPALLIDLAGHTLGNRLKILGRRPTPLQACLIGYPSTTGYAGVDVLVADPVLVPPEHEAFHTEAIARLPDSFLCFVVPPGMPAPRVAPLGRRPLRFGTLNAYAKINDTTLALWARVLAAVPRSELFVKCGEFAESDTRDGFRRRAAAAGIDPARLVLEGPSPFAEAMRAYHGIDIALDPTPYNGGTTTCHALFMGTPVVTLAGGRFSARMGASCLSAAGRPEWIASSADAYVAIAAGLAADGAALRLTRETLARTVRTSPLGDIERYAKAFAALCEQLAGGPGHPRPARLPRRDDQPSAGQERAEVDTDPTTPAMAPAIATTGTPSADTPRGAHPKPVFEITTSRLFEGFLGDAGVSLAITTCEAGMVLLIGTDPQTGRLWIFNRRVERPMGIACDRARIAVAGLTQIVTFVDGHHGTASEGADPVYVPQIAHFTGDLDVHDLAFDGAGDIVFVNTLFSCLSAVSATHSFRPVFQPRFVSRLAAEDRCHLNGLAMRDGEPAFVTAAARSDVAGGWREHRHDGGVVVDVPSGEIVAHGLSMPHSPRWFDGRLWILNAGSGEIGTVEPATGAFTPVAFCPGYLRGMTFVDRFAIVGVSQPRANGTFGGLALQERLEREGVSPRCGLFVVDTATGDVVHWLRVGGVVTELFDIAVIPRARQPQMIGFRSDEIRRVVSIEPPRQHG